MAAQYFHGLAILTKKESMGLCFVGKRNMTDFLSNYFTLTPGRLENNLLYENYQHTVLLDFTCYEMQGWWFVVFHCFVI